MDWKNINLKSPYETAQNLLENYTFDTLLLEISCNIKEINTETVRAQALDSIRAKYQEAIEILDSNLSNITKESQRLRAIN